MLTLFAGLATVAGGYLATRRSAVSPSVLATTLAFAAGAMIFIAFAEVLPHGLGQHTGETYGHATTNLHWWVYGAFFVGMLIVATIDRLLPSHLNPTPHDLGKRRKSAKSTQKALARSGLFVAIVLALHNFPEGLSTFLAAYEEPSVGLALAFAIAIHNVPEGIAIAAPIYAATKSKKKALGWTFLSGLAEPAGALVGFMLIGSFIPSELNGAIFGLVAGMMVFVSLNELLPSARKYQKHPHQVVYGIFLGMMVSALSLLVI